MFNKIINQFFELLDFLSYLFKRKQLRPKKPELLQMIEEAKADWQLALQHLNICDREMIDFAIHEYQAKERRFMALLQQARREGITAPWI